MTWILKLTRSDRPMIAEYLCPVHGRFELEVARDEKGNPPEEMPCGAEDREQWPDRHGHHHVNRCGLTSPFAISASGYAKVKAVEAVRGGYEKAERPTYTDTTNLGEGQDLDDWWDDRAKVWERQRENEIKELSNG